MKQRNFFSAEAVKKLTKSLKEVLASTYVLYLKTQNFHWNVEGRHFFFLHKMFEEQYEELAEAVDTLAERIRQFSVKSPGSMKEFLSLSELKESANPPEAKKMIEELYADHQAIANILHQKIKEAQEFSDEGTADVYIDRLRVHDKTAWMLKSHLEEK